MNRKILVLSAVTGLLAPALLAGCGSSDGGSGGGGDIVVGTTDQVAATKEDPAPLDPAFTYDTSTWNIIRQTIQTLMYVPRGGGQPIGEAANCSFTDKENESYRCKLRAGLKFSNGDPVTAEDVKFSIERVVNIAAPAGASGLLTNIDKIETSGDLGVTFHLKTPDATFPYKLSTPIAGIVNPKSYDPKKLRSGFEVDGSGPYIFKASVTNDKVTKVTFTKNPGYKGALKLQNNKVEMRSFPTAEAMGSALDTGDIDVMLRTMTPQQIKSMTEHPKKGIELTEMPGLEIRYLGFDTSDPSVKNRAVRQAMAYLIDRSQIINTVYGSTADPLYSLIPAGITSHTNSFFNKYGEPNKEKAAQLLKDADITTPIKLTLNYTTDHYGAATAKEFDVLKSQLNASGLFDVTTKGTEWTTYRPAETKGKYAVYGLGWFPDFPDADNYIAPFLDEGNFLNTPYVNVKTRTQLIPDSRKKADRSTATATFGEIQNIVAEDVPVLPLWQGKQYVAARDDVSGVEWAVNSSAEVHLWELGRGSGTS
jgi:peptide/nickel transport system substrate-binding protein